MRSPATIATGVLTPLEADALACIYTHRIVASNQLRAWLIPNANGPRYLTRGLESLRTRGLVANAGRRGRRELLWYVTSDGAAAAEEYGQVVPRTWRLDPDKAAVIDARHTLMVNDTGTAFLTWARRLGHECTPLDWTPEVAHRLRTGGVDRPGDLLIADAVLQYVVPLTGRRVHRQLFLEIDRSTMTVARLAAKLPAYARYHDFEWKARYPAFPDLLFVLDGIGEQALAQRIADLRAYSLADRRFARLAGQVHAGATTLTQLRDQGPFAPIFTPLHGPDPTPRDFTFTTAEERA